MPFLLSRFQVGACSFLSDNLRWRRKSCRKRPIVRIEVQCLCVNELTWERALCVGPGHQPCLALMKYCRQRQRESVCVHIYTVLLLALFKSVQFFAKDIQPDKLLPTQIRRTPMHTKNVPTRGIVLRNSWHPVLHSCHSGWCIYSETLVCHVPFGTPLAFLSKQTSHTYTKTHQHTYFKIKLDTKTQRAQNMIKLIWVESSPEAEKSSSNTPCGVFFLFVLLKEMMVHSANSVKGQLHSCERINSGTIQSYRHLSLSYMWALHCSHMPAWPATQP